MERDVTDRMELTVHGRDLAAPADGLQAHAVARAAPPGPGSGYGGGPDWASVAP